MPKTMREQLEESFEDAEEKEEAGGPDEDPTESLGLAEETGEDTPVDDDAGAPEGDPEDKGDEPVSADADEPGDEASPEDPPAGQEDSKPPVLT